MTPDPRAAGRLADLALIVQFVLIWTTFFVLSSAIGWPASLDDPAVVALPRLTANAQPVFLGYGAYLLGALLLVPATAALNVRLGLVGGLASLTLSLAVLSAVFKTIGIARWLFAMPMLADAWASPGADRGAISLGFDLLNAYAGGVGEVLGVGLMSGLWTLVVGAVVARRRGWSARLAGAWAIVAGAGLFLTIPGGFGVEMGPTLTVTNIAWQFALLFLALWALGRPKSLMETIR